MTRKTSSASTSSVVSSRRPASVVIHDNEELLRLAEELQSQEMALKGGQPKSSSASNLVRRNSSGYSSGGSRDRLSKTVPQSASKWPGTAAKVSSQVSQGPPGLTNGPARPPQSPIRSRSYKGVVNKVRAAESNLDPRRSSMCAVGEFRPRTAGTLTSRSQLESSKKIFGSGSKKGHHSEGQDKVKGQEKVTRRQKSHDGHSASDAKRAAFLQNRGPIQKKKLS